MYVSEYWTLGQVSHTSGQWIEIFKFSIAKICIDDIIRTAIAAAIARCLVLMDFDFCFFSRAKPAQNNKACLPTFHH
jgi:hypothetical protein